MFYYSMINIGLGEMCPVNKIELLFCVISLMISVLVFFFIFSAMSSLMVLYGEESRQQQEELDLANSMMGAI